ncbi:MAG: hypothetical protein AAF456_08330 [Planctomycetota bacterium]
MFSNPTAPSANGAKIVVDKDEFMRLAKSAKPSTVVYVPSRWYTMGHTYMLSHGGLYVITTTKQELPIPRHIEVIKATGILGMACS